MNVNWDYINKRFDEYWHLENHDRPLMTLAINHGHLPSQHATHRDRWLDVEYNIKAARYAFEHTTFLGEGFPMMNPNLGPDIMAAVTNGGIDIEFGANTSWATRHIEDWSAQPPLKLAHNDYYKTITQLTQAAIDDAKGDYVVCVTDIHSGMDGLVSLRGAEQTCIDIADEPEELDKRLIELYDCCTEFYTDLENIIRKNQSCSTNWMGIINASRWYVTSCDLACMVGHNDWMRFIQPVLNKELDFFGNSIFHLDGPDALRHLDTLLANPKLFGIQWVYGAGQPSARHWLDVLKRIQAAGKGIHIHCDVEDVPVLVEHLKPEGVCMTVGCPDVDTANALLKLRSPK